MPERHRHVCVCVFVGVFFPTLLGLGSEVTQLSPIMISIINHAQREKGNKWSNGHHFKINQLKKPFKNQKSNKCVDSMMTAYMPFDLFSDQSRSLC